MGGDGHHHTDSNDVGKMEGIVLVDSGIAYTSEAQLGGLQSANRERSDQGDSMGCIRKRGISQRVTTKDGNPPS